MFDNNTFKNRFTFNFDLSYFRYLFYTIFYVSLSALFVVFHFLKCKQTCNIVVRNSTANFLELYDPTDGFLFNLFFINSVSKYFESLHFAYFTSYSAIFFILFSSLFPIIFYLLSHDFDSFDKKNTTYMFTVFLLSYLLLAIDNMFIFFFIYETIIILVFRIMYKSSNSRGGIEASLFYAGWAILGSVFVGIGLILIICITKTSHYSLLQEIQFPFTATETYVIYFLLFFGFGVKLSVWPFWYWLPKAHVEVSTGVSIFLSCILIKLSYFSLLKFKFIFNSEISYNFFILVILYSSFDVVSRVVNVRDLKSLIAHGSVLHTNLLLLLTHIDNIKFFKGLALYILGHSYATAALFICVNLIEAHYGSRNITVVSGLWQVSPLTARVTFFSILSFLDLPLNSFYWAEFWLWLVIFQKLPLISLFLIFWCNFVFLFFFFKTWWGVLHGTPTVPTKTKLSSQYITIYYIIITILLVLFLGGLQPSVLYILISTIN